MIPSKKILIELYKKKIPENIRTNGSISMRFKGEYISLLGFSFNHKIQNSFHACFIGITPDGDGAINKNIYFNSISEELEKDEYLDLLNTWKEAVRHYDFNLLEDLASKSDIDISRRVLTEKRTGKEKIKF